MKGAPLAVNSLPRNIAERRSSCTSRPFCLRHHTAVAPLLSTHAVAALLTKETCRCISRVCALLFLPALMIASTGATLNPTALKDAWQLVVAGSFTIVFSRLVAWAAGQFVFRRPEDRRAFHPVGLAIAFPNSAAFPLLLMDTLCEQDYIKRYGDHSRTMFRKIAPDPPVLVILS